MNEFMVGQMEPPLLIEERPSDIAEIPTDGKRKQFRPCSRRRQAKTIPPAMIQQTAAPPASRKMANKRRDMHETSP
jgi:hypothetical protein